MKQEKQKIYEEPRIKVVHFMVEGGFQVSAGGEGLSYDAPYDPDAGNSTGSGLSNRSGLSDGFISNQNNDEAYFKTF